MHMFGPRRSELHRDQAARHVADQHRNGERRRRGPGPLLIRTAMLILERFQSADAAADDYAETVALFRLSRSMPLSAHRHFRRGHRQLRKAIGPPRVLWIFEERLRIEIAHLARRSGNRNRWCRRRRSARMPLTPSCRFFQNVSRSLPTGVTTPIPVMTTLRSVHDDDSVKRLKTCHVTASACVPIPTLCTVWKSFPSVLIEGAMMISVC